MDVKEMFDLTGKTALITGGGRGLGQQMAEVYAEVGCNVVLCSRKLANCEETATNIKEKYGVRAEAYELNVRDETSVKQVAETVRNNFGQIDILVNNSGATWAAPAEEMPLEAWKKVMEVNVDGTFLMSKEVGKHMIEQGGGRIINIASAGGLRVRPPELMNTIGYTTSKAAVIHFTKDLAMKWAQYGINVNAIAPGMFRTQMTKGALEEKEKRVLSSIPLNKIGDDQMLKGAALFLATKASEFVTGHILSVDGGSSL